MEKLTVAVSIIGIIGAISSTYFTYLAYRKNNMQEQKVDGKAEGTMLSDIVYIKTCVERVEKNLNKVDERYRNIVERLVKVEEAVANVTKRVDKL